jgi:hypothetical protein
VALRTASRALARLIIRLVGGGLLVFSLPLYQSFQDREILGRWSPGYVVVMLVAALAWLGWVIAGVATAHRHPGRSPTVPARLLDLAVLAAGAGYGFGAWSDRTSAAKILELNLIGAIPGPSVILGWLALVAVVAAGAITVWTRREARWATATLPGPPLPDSRPIRRSGGCGVMCSLTRPASGIASPCSRKASG